MTTRAHVLVALPANAHPDALDVHVTDTDTAAVVLLLDAVTTAHNIASTRGPRATVTGDVRRGSTTCRRNNETSIKAWASIYRDGTFRRDP
jgi:hypothetical protein